jgi:RNA polymerase sigma-70 factor (ECF subfamily)
MPVSSVIETEATLLARVATGDRRAFSELYDRMQHRVLGLTIRILKDAAQSEEVAQEVFLEVWQCASRFDAERGSAVAWILHKTHGKAVDRVRSSQAHQLRDLRIGIRDLAAPAENVSDVVELKVESERVGRALHALPAAQREAVRLAHLEGYSHSEVSELLHVPIGTVKTRIRTGILKLREELTLAS